MAQLNTLPTFAKPEENKVEKLFQSILGGTVAQPQPSFADELKMANEKASQEAKLKAEKEAKARRVTSLGKKAVAKQEAVKAPLDKGEPKTAYDESVEKFDNFIKEELSGIDTKKFQGSGKFNTFSPSIPKDADFATTTKRAQRMYDILAGTPDTYNSNAELLKIAKENYDKKADNPYRNVDLESIDRLIASTFGGKVQGMKNVAEPVNEFNVLSGLVNKSQEDRQLRAKEILHNMETMLRPVNTGALSIESLKPVVPRGSGSNDRMVDKDVINAYAKLDEKNGPILQKFNQVEDNLRAGDMTSLKTSLPILAKTVGSDVGNIALQEAERYMPANLNMSFANLISYIESNPSYPVPIETAKAVAAYVKRAKSEFLSRVASEKERINKSFAASPVYKVPNERIHGSIGPDLESKYSSKDNSDKIKRLKELLNKGKK